MQASNSIRGEGFTVLRLAALYPPGCSYGRAIDANAKVRVLFFVAFWAGFVSRVRSLSGPARRVGALRWLRDALRELSPLGRAWTAESKFASCGRADGLSKR